MRKRKLRAPKWVAVVVIFVATFAAIGTAGFGYVVQGGGGWYGWDSYFGHTLSDHTHGPVLTQYVFPDPYFRACDGAHCGHLSAPAKLLGVYDCLAPPCGPNLSPYPARSVYPPLDCYYARCSPLISIGQISNVNVDVDVDNNARIYGGRGTTISDAAIDQNADVNVHVH